MNLIVSSYRFCRVLRIQAIFGDAIRSFTNNKIKVVQLVEDMHGNSEMRIVEKDAISVKSSAKSSSVSSFVTK